MNMKNVRIFVVLLCLVLMISCEKDSKLVTPFYPVASFETLKEIYEDGEAIHFENTSQHAVSQLWKFGDLATSTERDPVFIYRIPDDFLGLRFAAVLEVTGKDGQVDTARKVLRVSKRIFHDLVIHQLSDEVLEKIPHEEGKETRLIVLFGYGNNKLDWIKPDQTIPSKPISREMDLPFRMNHSLTWPDAPMHKANWFLRLSAETEDKGERSLLKEFQFDPTVQEAVQVSERVWKFFLSDGDDLVSVEFTYISKGPWT
jgi:hypothetical protein